MDFGLSEEQEMLRDAARKFLEHACPARFVRAMMADPTGHSPDLWRQIAELGWLGILIPEEHGGLGGSFVDLGVVLEETGRVLLPGPFFATTVLGSLAVALAGSPEQKTRVLPAVARGERRLALALVDADDRYDAEGVTVPGRRDGADWTLAGEKRFVMDAHVAETLVVAARTGGSSEAGVTLFLIDAAAPPFALVYAVARKPSALRAPPP